MIFYVLIGISEEKYIIHVQSLSLLFIELKKSKSVWKKTKFTLVAFTRFTRESSNQVKITWLSSLWPTLKQKVERYNNARLEWCRHLKTDIFFNKSHGSGFCSSCRLIPLSVWMCENLTGEFLLFRLHNDPHSPVAKDVFLLSLLSDELSRSFLHAVPSQPVCRGWWWTQEEGIQQNTACLSGCYPPIADRLETFRQFDNMWL